MKLKSEKLVLTALLVLNYAVRAIRDGLDGKRHLCIP